MRAASALCFGCGAAPNSNCERCVLVGSAAAAAAIGMAVQELNCLAQAVAVASMAATETQRFDLNVVLQTLPEARPKTYPVYDKLQQTVRYSQVLNNDQLASLILREEQIRDVLGVARSLWITRLDEARSAVIFGDDRDHLHTVVTRLMPRCLPSGHVRSYLAQMCAICEDLHARSLTLQGALSLSSFALDKCDHVFLLSSACIQLANSWRPGNLNPQYTAPEVLRASLQLREDLLRLHGKLPTSSFSSPYDSFTCDTFFRADAYSVGICGLIMATGKVPFPLKLTRSATADYWIQHASELVPEIPNDLDKDLRCLLCHMLSPNPEQRISINQALHHPALHAFVGHLRRSPPVRPPPHILNFMQQQQQQQTVTSTTTTPITAATTTTSTEGRLHRNGRLQAGDKQRQRHVVTSANTETLIPQLLDTASSDSSSSSSTGGGSATKANCCSGGHRGPDHLSLHGAISLPASPECSDQDEACCEGCEILGDLERQREAKVAADHRELVSFVDVMGGNNVVDNSSSISGDDNDNNNNNTAAAVAVAAGDDEALSTLSNSSPPARRRVHPAHDEIRQQTDGPPHKRLLAEERAHGTSSSQRMDQAEDADTCSSASVTSLRRPSSAGHADDDDGDDDGDDVVMPELSDVGSVGDCGAGDSLRQGDKPLQRVDHLSNVQQKKKKKKKKKVVSSDGNSAKTSASRSNRGVASSVSSSSDCCCVSSYSSSATTHRANSAL